MSSRSRLAKPLILGGLSSFQKSRTLVSRKIQNLGIGRDAVKLVNVTQWVSTDSRASPTRGGEPPSL